MKMLRLVLLLSMAILLVLGCSKKQEDASKLEQEIMVQEGQAADSVADVHATPGDTLTDDALAPDVAAIPDEEPQFEATRPTGDGYTVQVAACEDLEYAHYLVNTYVSRGYEPFLTSTVEDGQTFYRVRIGSFEGYGEASAVMAELVDKYSLHGAWIDRASN